MKHFLVFLIRLLCTCFCGLLKQSDYMCQIMFGKINNGSKFFADGVLESITKVMIASIVHTSGSRSG